jgi:hypothetical protein
MQQNGGVNEYYCSHLHRTKPDSHDDEKGGAVHDSWPDSALDSHIPRILPPRSTVPANRDGLFSHIGVQKRMLCVFLRNSIDVGRGGWRVGWLLSESKLLLCGVRRERGRTFSIVGTVKHSFFVQKSVVNIRRCRSIQSAFGDPFYLEVG